MTCVEVYSDTWYTWHFVFGDMCRLNYTILYLYVLDPCVQCFPTECFVVVHPPADSSQKRTTPDLLAISQCLATHGGIERNMYIQIYNLQLDISVRSLSIKDQPCSHNFVNTSLAFETFSKMWHWSEGHALPPWKISRRRSSSHMAHSKQAQEAEVHEPWLQLRLVNVGKIW